MSDALRVYYCRSCRRETAQRFAGAENGNRPKVMYYACTVCRLQLITYADVKDAEGFVLYLYDQFVKATGTHVYDDVRSLEREDVLGQIRVELWAAYLAWDPTRSRRFTPYATWRVPNRIKNYLLALRGDNRARHGTEAERSDYRKPLSDALSLDAPAPTRGGGSGADDGDGASGLERAHGSRDSAPDGGRVPSLAGVLAARGSGIAREIRDLGIDAARGTAGGARARHLARLEE